MQLKLIDCTRLPNGWRRAPPRQRHPDPDTEQWFALVRRCHDDPAFRARVVALMRQPGGKAV